MYSLNQFLSFFRDREILIIFTYILLMAIIPGFGVVAALHLIFMALIKGKEWYFKSLVYFSLLKHFNPIFHPPSTNLFILFAFLLFVVFLFKAISRSHIQFFALEKKFYILLTLFTITSLIGSLYVDFSLIRLSVLWILVFSIFHSLRYIGDFDILKFFVRISAIVIYASLPLIFVNAGYMSRVSFFKGLIYHSQDFAMILLPLYMIYLVAISSKKVLNNSFHTLTLAIGFLEIILSASRSAMFAIIGAYILYMLLTMKKKYSIKKIMLSSFILFVFVVSFISNSEKYEQKIQSFFLKYEASGSSDTIQDSVKIRLFLIETSKQNFLKNPMTGIGFNVQTWYQDVLVRIHLDELIKYIPGTNIMYSRPLEKGNLYASVFEEGGALVGLYFLYLILFIVFFLYRSRTPYIWVPFVAMLINFNGEASLFSPSGAGNFQLLVIAALYIMSKEKKKKVVI